MRGPATGGARILHLQRTIGNGAVTRLLAREEAPDGGTATPVDADAADASADERGSKPEDLGKLRAEAARRLVARLNERKAVYGHQLETRTKGKASWQQRKAGWWWDETEFDCSKFVLWVLAGREAGAEQTGDENAVAASPFGRIQDVSSVAAMLAVIDGLAKEGKAPGIRQAAPLVGDLILWEGHVGIVVDTRQGKDDTEIVFAHMGTSGAAEVGRTAAGFWWLKVGSLAGNTKLASGAWKGFWTP